ncbi:hypothetical protein [Streptomyces caniscabiei]|uniref:Secreted protein n=1 Tax=Streptomyces caniscabiei TaxID=2746961 RepID=A0ABU4N0J3_9ACTN|nr:hypothetical protein [Streptomyces caniscabiei]MBE4790284.1 hypothetical protein [Streptomyces caniscabiei]MBE4799487.1 hypothetical protein [Streptomyces caniscabiei]MDX3015141.1 hypothetical protein [Streptomyces caniscabiei]MDX3042584.1 hypothetical protein [Streptomyces caniscabiei]
MRFRTLASNVLLPAVTALAIVTAWIWSTGSTAMSALTVIGLALASAGASMTVEWLVRQVRRAWRRRTRPPRHRKPAV